MLDLLLLVVVKKYIPIGIIIKANINKYFLYNLLFIISSINPSTLANNRSNGPVSLVNIVFSNKVYFKTLKEYNILTKLL